MRSFAPLLCLLTTGCAVQLGKHVGGAGPSPARLTHGAQVSAYTAPWTAGGIGFPHLGVEASAEVEHQIEDDRRYLGTHLTTGLQGGWSYWQDDSRLSLQSHFNLGMALFDSPYDAYLGATLAVPVDLGPIRNVTDMNHAFQLMARRISIVPYLRWRSSFGDDLWLHDTSLGLALRARLSTDLL